MGSINSFELVVTVSKRKSELFISQNFEPILLKDVVELILNNQLSDFQVIKTKSGIQYVRSKPNQLKSDNIDSISVTKSQLWRAYKDIDYRFANPITEQLEKNRNENIKTPIPKDMVFVLRWDEVAEDYVIPTPSKTKTQILDHLSKHKSVILKAAEMQNIDLCMMGAILVDEFCRLGPDDWFDWLGFLGMNTSIGLSQIKVNTARSVIRKKLYIPEKDVDFDSVFGREKLVFLLNDPFHSANFCAAIIRDIIDRWKPKFDMSNRTDLVGTLYSLSNPPKPHKNPRSNGRGRQIAEEFYPLEKKPFN